MWLRIVLFLLVGSTLFVSAPLAAQQQKFLTVELANRHLEGTVYYADIWIVVKPGAEWIVSETTIWVLFNVNALNPTAYLNQSVPNFDAELAASGYVSQYHYLPAIPAVSIDILAPPAFSGCVVKGGPQGETFRLGTLRWNVTDFSAMDYVRFLSNDHPWLTHRFASRRPPPDDHLDSIITDIHWPQNDYSVNTWQNFYIAPSGCGSMFYEQPQNCGDNLRPVSTTTPLTRVSPHWPARPGPGLQPHVAYYQYDFVPSSLPNAGHSRSFDPGRLAGQLDEARCRWEAQLDHLYPPVTNYFEWQETPAGGRMFFTINPVQIGIGGLGATGVLALTNMARDEMNNSFFRDTAACGGQEYPNAFKRRSEIIFNNTYELYAANPHLRWTTDLGGCGGGPDCISFYETALHELGHYVGLAHEERNHTVVMTGASSLFPFPTRISSCDADNIRRLYNPTAVGMPPDNSFNCALVTYTEEQQAAVTEPAITALPSQVYDGNCAILYTLPHRGIATVKVLDLLGNEVHTIANGIINAGRHQVQMSTEKLLPGIYLVVLQSGGSTASCKLAIIH